jgi:hypothetical protein
VEEGILRLGNEREIYNFFCLFSFLTSILFAICKCITLTATHSGPGQEKSENE